MATKVARGRRINKHSQARKRAKEAKAFVVTNALVHETGLRGAELSALHKHYMVQMHTADMCSRADLPPRFEAATRTVSFSKYAAGIGLLRSRGTPEQRLKFLVGVYSADARDGAISRDALFTMLKASANLDAVRKNAFEVDVKAFTRVMQHVKRQLMNRTLGVGDALIPYDAVLEILNVPMKAPPVAPASMIEIKLDALLKFWTTRDEAEMHGITELHKLEKTLSKIPVFVDHAAEVAAHCADVQAKAEAKEAEAEAAEAAAQRAEVELKAKAEAEAEAAAKKAEAAAQRAEVELQAEAEAEAAAEAAAKAAAKEAEVKEETDVVKGEAKEAEETVVAAAEVSDSMATSEAAVTEAKEAEAKASAAERAPAKEAPAGEDSAVETSTAEATEAKGEAAVEAGEEKTVGEGEDAVTVEVKVAET